MVSLTPSPALAAPAPVLPAPAAPVVPVPAPAALVAPAAKSVVAPSASVPRPTGSRGSIIVPGVTSRFALEFGPFFAPADAEQVERQLTQAGLPTVRFRQKTGGRLYAVLLERIPGVPEAQALVGTLREQGHGEAVVLREDPPLVRVSEPLPLRPAVQLGGRLRADGHEVRVATQPGEAVAFTIRHGNFPSKREADARAEELGRLGLVSQVVQVR